MGIEARYFFPVFLLVCVWIPATLTLMVTADDLLPKCLSGLVGGVGTALGVLAIRRIGMRDARPSRIARLRNRMDAIGRRLDVPTFRATASNAAIQGPVTPPDPVDEINREFQRLLENFGVDDSVWLSPALGQSRSASDFTWALVEMNVIARSAGGLRGLLLLDDAVNFKKLVDALIALRLREARPPTE